MGVELMLGKVAGEPNKAAIPALVDAAGYLQTEHRMISVGAARGSGTYTAGDCVGAGGGLVKIPTGCVAALLEGVTVLDLDGQNIGFQILFYAQAPVAGAWVDNGALSPSAAESQKICGMVTVEDADFASIGGRSVADLSGLNVPLFAGNGMTAGTTIYYVIRTTGAPTYVNGIMVHFKVRGIAAEIVPGENYLP